MRSGRLPDPTRDDEIFVNRKFADTYGVHVGSQVTIVSSDDLTAFWGMAPMTGGPTVPATVVGIGISEMDMTFSADQPTWYPSVGFLAQHGDQVPAVDNLLVRLKPGTDVQAFGERAGTALGLASVPVRDFAEDSKRFTHSTDLEQTGLYLFALTVALAGLVLIGQALTRTVYGMADDTPTLRAMGMSRSQLTVGLLAPVTIAMATGVLVAVPAAIGLSALFPVGLSRQLEPDLGMHADWLAIIGGATVLLATMAFGAALATRRALRGRTIDNRPPGRGSRLARAARQTRAVPLSIGVGLALESGRGRRALPTRPALAGTIVGVVGIVSAAGLLSGIDRAVSDPALAGQVWQGDVYVDDDSEVVPIEDRLQRHAEVDQIAAILKADAPVDGVGLPLFALDPVQGNMTFVVLTGRAPAAPDEIAIGPATATRLGVGVGDTVSVGTDPARDLEVVGIELLPQTPHSSFDQGAAVTRSTLEAAAESPDLIEGGIGFTVHDRSDATTSAVLDDLNEAGFDGELAIPPQDVLLLQNVTSLPKALAAFVGLLAIAALAHVLVSTVRYRRKDLAILRAPGPAPTRWRGPASPGRR